jgi:uncharacterized repeat protein (TIGR03803 family)
MQSATSVRRLQNSTAKLLPICGARSCGERPGGTGKLSGWKRVYALFMLCAITAIASRAQTFTTLLSFDGSNGSNPQPYGSLVQGLDGKFYGITQDGGANGYGTVFKITRSGTLTTLHSFCVNLSNRADGAYPVAGLLLATNGSLYGSTYQGGGNNCSSSCGTVFEITPNGTLTTLYTFCAKANCADGAFPVGTLVQAAGGEFYGTTLGGGAYGRGTVFKITQSGTLTTLYSFKLGSPLAGLVQATDGNFYGTAEHGGEYDHGKVFKITPSGKLTTLYSFCSEAGCPDGSRPDGALIQADGNFYGPTLGTNIGFSTVFKMTAGGQLTTLYTFCSQNGCDDGDGPSSLVQAADGNFYGAAYNDGGHGCGTVFELTPAGSLTTLHSFDDTDGCNPFGGLLQATNGKFYGTPYFGGGDSRGTVFSLDVGLPPFVEGLPYSDKVGKNIKILGQGLTGTTAVSFNGTAASFTVKSDTYLVATVPNGATTGFVTVTTPGGALTSNRQFRVTP